MSSANEERVAKRYAKALFDLCNPTDFDRVQEQLSALASVWQDSSELRDSMLNPRVPASARMAIINAAVDSLGGYASETLQKLMNTLISARRIAILPALAELFALFVAEYRRSLSLEVVVASESEASSVETMRTQLSHTLGGEVTLQVRTDPALLGGLTIRLGDRYLDRSVAGTLQRIALQLG